MFGSLWRWFWGWAGSEVDTPVPAVTHVAQWARPSPVVYWQAPQPIAYWGRSV